MTLQISRFDISPLRPRVFSRTARIVLALGLAGFIAAFSFWFSSRDTLAAAGQGALAQSTASISVADTPFPFKPTACVVLDQSFIAAGPGSNGYGDYWVSATESQIEILFNVDSEVDTPPPGDEWLESGDIGWSSPSEGTVIAVTKMTATRDLLTGGRGVLNIECRQP